MTSQVLGLWKALQDKPAGRWLFSRMVCFKAPYFGSIAPRMITLEPGRGVARIAHRRRVTNHLGTVHAIALCNLAEFTGGLVCDASMPKGMRWIPKGMTVEYLKKATGTMTATATTAFAPQPADAGYALPVQVDVHNDAGERVFQARIDMWVSPAKREAQA